ncbi:GNAT family N-acetyltransferase [Nesterenkonia sp. NBAIMH1]|uniref:GNAT family N-acetyltransferase n=1 Tax=Nesterenkonia sp. NBAIMH1 TaxID=2600320 RepID=UPI0011B40689|nr:GNAT family N-acetyltransferase [Nesterenkonia sp. NBAIMH1]
MDSVEVRFRPAEETDRGFLGRMFELTETGERTAAGGAWLRAFAADEPGYGFVEERFSELAIALLPEFTGRGLGPWLLRETLRHAEAMGLPGVSLSVEVGNDRALQTYERNGFRHMGLHASGGAHTMLCTREA